MIEKANEILSSGVKVLLQVDKSANDADAMKRDVSRDARGGEAVDAVLVADHEQVRDALPGRHHLAGFRALRSAIYTMYFVMYAKTL